MSKNKSNLGKKSFLVVTELASAYFEDSVLSFWCKSQIEALTIGEVPVKNQQDLILWIVLSNKKGGIHNIKTNLVEKEIEVVCLN